MHTAQYSTSYVKVHVTQHLSQQIASCAHAIAFWEVGVVKRGLNIVLILSMVTLDFYNILKCVVL